VQHNRLIVFEDKRYQYDEHGRLIEKRIGRHTTVRLRWNKEHQLVESTTERNGVRQNSRYEYDALGRRILRKDLFGETRFLWDGMRLLQEKRGDQNTTYVYQPGTHEPIARIDDTDPDYRPPGAQAKIYHFHTHINGAPEELTDETGQTLWRARYKTWGNLALEESFAPLPERDRAEHATKQPIRMQGQYADTETGLYYNTFRYYDPDVGRFISEDPIGLLGGLNLYQFAPNADGWVDPWGWKPCFANKAAEKRAETIIKRHGGVKTSEGHYQMPNRRAARQAGSEIAGDLGYNAETIRKKDFGGGPKSWKNSEGKIGKQKKDETAGWRDDSPGHKRFGAGPHVNAWNESIGINKNLHLDY
jgi:RHS repeat-associated protein